MRQLIFSFLLLTFLGPWTACDHKKKMGEEAVQKIESYRQTNNKLPETLRDIGILEKEEGPIYYTKKSEEDYIVWYGLMVGESMIYDSKTKKWRESD